jgi:hypothetical protein
LVIKRIGKRILMMKEVMRMMGEAVLGKRGEA